MQEAAHVMAALGHAVGDALVVEFVDELFHASQKRSVNIDSGRLRAARPTRSAAAQREPSYIQLSPREREAARGAAGVGRVAGPVGAGDAGAWR
jgi:hypothetical protein